ncbi:phosphoribosyl transferase domain protein [Chaetomium sp. MPI-SDFR-AT-0129]|nr:phosphoribosyl transferase domain protein [Chaetomium sp. MPI-SDFR-AT-0129]
MSCTLDFLKEALKQAASSATASFPKQPLVDTEYEAGFKILSQGHGWKIYQEFIIPQLCELLGHLFASHREISVLEIGPGPATILEQLPKDLRQNIAQYTAFEPNGLFASNLENRLRIPGNRPPVFPSLNRPANINRIPYRSVDCDACGEEQFDVVIFCHSLYGIAGKDKAVQQAVQMLTAKRESMVLVFHRERIFLNGLVCRQTASFPEGAVVVKNEDAILDSFAAFMVGFSTTEECVRAEWRSVCRQLGRRSPTDQTYLLFRAPEVMVVLSPSALSLPGLAIAGVPTMSGDRIVKNSIARHHRPAAIARPTSLHQVQECVRWALKTNTSLTVIAGGHSGQCILPNVVALDMGAFNRIHIVPSEQGVSGLNPDPLVVADAGCNAGDIIRGTIAVGLTVPLGARPSVGAGLWLQGGIGHLSRLHGLACDAIVGAVVIRADSAEVVTVGTVPKKHRPVGSKHMVDTDLLWALKGAGSNFGVVARVIFKAYPAPMYTVRHWIFPLVDIHDARHRFDEFDKAIAKALPRTSASDAYLYWHDGNLRLGITVYQMSFDNAAQMPLSLSISATLGPELSVSVVDGVGAFESEMYMSAMHGGHGGGRTSSFKRCLLLKNIANPTVVDILAAGLQARPTPLCYFHLLHGGGAVGDVLAHESAFGLRDWEFACVITGVWRREEDGSHVARDVVDWVYRVARDLLPVSHGGYAADLGPDPRDQALAANAFGANAPRLAHLKRVMDPRGIFGYACPLPRVSPVPQLIVLVTGDSGVGKDYCALVWDGMFTEHGIRARTASISETLKREYAVATGADLPRLLHDRKYKEHRRSDLTRFFANQVRVRRSLPEDHFLSLILSAEHVDVLFITGMRDDVPVASLSHLASESRMIEVCVTTSLETRQERLGRTFGEPPRLVEETSKGDASGSWNPGVLGPSADLTFSNDEMGVDQAKEFGVTRLLPFFRPELEKLAGMVGRIPDFPRPGVDFRHLLGIAQQPGGLDACTSLLMDLFLRDSHHIDTIVGCEAGGFIFASALASRLSLPIALIRNAGKLPPPTISVAKSASHISASEGQSLESQIEMGRDVIPPGGSVVVVDDVLATGRTLSAVLRLLREGGVDLRRVRVMVVAEFPLHRGRRLLVEQGFGQVNIHALLVLGGA